jgi:hypothetical protein
MWLRHAYHKPTLGCIKEVNMQALEMALDVVCSRSKQVRVQLFLSEEIQ